MCFIVLHDAQPVCVVLGQGLLLLMAYCACQVMVVRKQRLQKFVKRWGAHVLRQGLLAWTMSVSHIRQQRLAIAQRQERNRLLSLQRAFDM